MRTNVIDKSDLNRFLLEDRLFAKELGALPTTTQMLMQDHKYLIAKYIKLLRLDEHYSNNPSVINFLLRVFIKIKRNRLGAKLGILVPINTCDSGLIIWHYGNIIINAYAKIGKKCQLHGDNCIGNKGVGAIKAPVIGNNVDIGVGAKIIGDIYIADDVKIGANAVVVKSCYTKGATLIGVPAHEIKKENFDNYQ
ncbi:MAG: hypothetical protein ACI4J7_14510 [Ruminiclostridium sp.]